MAQILQAIHGEAEHDDEDENDDRYDDDNDNDNQCDDDDDNDNSDDSNGNPSVIQWHRYCKQGMVRVTMMITMTRNPSVIKWHKYWNG